jgi:gliding motility-associated-like protein
MARNHLMPLRILISVLLFLAIQSASAQSCTIQAGALKVCIGGTVTFNSPSVQSDSAYLWRFGDGSTSTQPAPTYQYNVAGTSTVELTKYRIGGTSCQAVPVQIVVFHKPIAKYSLQTPRVQCFDGNNFVFADSSRRGLSNAPINKRVFVLDDGSIIQQNAPFPSTVSHSYSNTAGSKYRVVLEVTDTNNCIDQYIDSVIVAPKRDLLIFTALQQVECNRTRVTFRNQSAYDSTNSARIWWILDSNVVFTSPWKELTYTYTGNRRFQPVLVIEDNLGCRDSVRLGYDIVSFNPDSAIHIYSSDKSCFRNNNFTFSDSTPIGNFSWTITTEDGQFLSFAQGRSYQYSFKNCGLYNIRLNYQYTNCNFQTDTQVYVYGPNAVLQNDTVKPINWVQCTVHDTVYFNKPDINCRYQNKNIIYMWNFGDPYAPPCTTDTRNGLNVGMNCNFSLDSVNIKHYYSHLNENCYWPSLYLVDPVLGCFDIDSVNLALAQPKGGWDSSFVPPRPRVYAIQSGCTSRVTFFLERLLPSCGPEKVWLLPDSPCTAWIKIDSSGIRKYYQHIYSKTCDSTGKITYGIVVTNGTDATGQRCYDTSWYHLQLERLIEIPFTPELSDSNLCSPHRYIFTPVDSIYHGIRELTWDFGDGSPLLRIPYGVNDSIVRPQTHIYARDGVYSITLIVEGRNGCIASAEQIIRIGKGVVITNNNPFICKGGEGEFTAEIRYFNDPFTRYWDDTLRRNQGKEQVYWNFGDTNVWIAGRENMKHTYNSPGRYQVRIAYKDSVTGGCFDTLAGIDLVITVQIMKAKIHVLTDTFYCAPAIVSFIDSSYYMNDTLTKQYNTFRREWDFGPERPISTLANPNVFFGYNGTFRVSLYAESIYGCYDVGEAVVTIIGPEPRFVIQSDTFGCAPFTVKLKNQTGKQLKNWIWYFNDPAQTFLSTRSDTDIQFTYTQPGIYKIDLLGEEDVLNPVTGSFKNCTSKFPYVDANFPFHSRQVLVLETDTLVIVSKDTICENAELVVQDNDSSGLSAVKWIWGDNEPDSMVNKGFSAAHRYDTSGIYLLRLEPVIISTSDCAIGTQKNIVVQKPFADFTFDPAQYPTFSFTNHSVNAVRYVWDFGQPLSGSINTSVEVNPVHTFVNEARDVKVCLMAFDKDDCMDSVCKPIPMRSSLKIPNVFTPGNNDGKNDAFDIDIEGWLKYELYIYNRWGTLVFEGFKDGFYNDGVNWDGRNKNDGSPCPEGVYFVVFRYRLFTEPQEKTYHGTVTLIRED